jgi:hypothetical protein
MKELKRPPQKTHVRISKSEMAADQQALFIKATDSLLAELVRSLDRRTQGDLNDYAEEPVARITHDHRRAAE